MKVKDIKNHLTKKTVGITAGALLALSIPVAALSSSPSTEATDEPPIVKQVNDHEGRITNLEGRADETDVKVGQNTTAIAGLQGSSSSSPAASGGGSSSTTPQSTVTPTPDTTPAPEPKKDPRYIVAVEYDIDHGSYRTCKYQLYDQRQNNQQGPVNQPVDKPCYKPGEVLPVGG